MPFDRVPLHIVGLILWKDRSQTIAWLEQHGYRVDRGVVKAAPTVLDNEARYAALRASAPFHVPCWRCGCRVCGHREAA